MVVQIAHTSRMGGIAGLVKRLTGLTKKSVYVGIPQSASSRPDEEINNASLLYIHTHGIRRRSMIRAMEISMNQGMKYSEAFKLYVFSHGSPLWHSPPRPVIEPALANSKDRINRGMARVFVAAASGVSGAEDVALNRLGLTGQNIARDWFTNSKNGWAPNAPYTLKHKKSRRPLIDTGKLRKSIIYVVR